MTRAQRIAFLVLAACAVATLAVIGLSSAAHGSDVPHDITNSARHDGDCTKDQAAAAKHGQAGGYGKDHSGDVYRCTETVPQCYRWKWVYDGRPHTGASYTHRPCTVCSSSPSRSGSASAQASPPTSAPASPTVSSSRPAPSMTPAASILPITGSNIVWEAAGMGTGLIVLGGAIYVAAGRRLVRRRR